MTHGRCSILDAICIILGVVMIVLGVNAGQLIVIVCGVLCTVPAIVKWTGTASYPIMTR